MNSNNSKGKACLLLRKVEYDSFDKVYQDADPDIGYNDICFQLIDANKITQVLGSIELTNI